MSVGGWQANPDAHGLWWFAGFHRGDAVLFPCTVDERAGPGQWWATGIWTRGWGAVGPQPVDEMGGMWKRIERPDRPDGEIASPTSPQMLPYSRADEDDGL